MIALAKWYHTRGSRRLRRPNSQRMRCAFDSKGFLTYRTWSDGLRGFVGRIPFQNRTDGFTYGVQAETWW